MFLACAAIRLARFNVLSNQSPSSKKYFKGLSSPVAATGLALSLWMFWGEVPADVFYWVGFVITFGLAILMVSNVRFRSFKDLDFRRYPTQTFLITMLILVLIFSFRENALFGFFILYLVSGLVQELILFRRRRKSDPSVPFLPFGDR
jgi:CDP-diacylglycerol--serine O-phosphatidyltransferase